MFCNQCEQTAKGQGCTVQGVCGKTDVVAGAQDTLVQALRSLAVTALKARDKGIVDADADAFVAHALFATLTNVNFDADALESMIRETLRRRQDLARRLGCTVEDCEASVRKALDALRDETVRPDQMGDGEDVRSAMQLLLYGLKGVAAYADHAAVLGQNDPELSAFLHKGLAAGFDGKQRGLEQWLELVLECGKANLRAMELLEKGNTSAYGDPAPTQVSLGARKGRCILVSGHDLKDLHDLLLATEGKGINIYTHGEMLPAHGYPQLKRFAHLAGHYGTAWQNQHKEFPGFPGPILFTTNCIQDPKEQADKVFTTGVAGWPGLAHCPSGNGADRFAPVVAKALAMPGFTEDKPGDTVLTGFGKAALLGAAPQVLEAVKAGALRHIFLVGGCDGAKPGRNYYTEFVEKTPADTLVLTLACGKFRFFDKKLGQIGPFPRLLDVGQCNDAYVAVQVALALADALKCTVNDLPLSLVLSWYEQKAVSILLTLLALGVKNVRIGPSLPAFVSPAILDLLVKNWGVTPITTPDEDLKTLLS